jgi:hypothetical protein
MGCGEDADAEVATDALAVLDVDRLKCTMINSILTGAPNHASALSFVLSD